MTLGATRGSNRIKSKGHFGVIKVFLYCVFSWMFKGNLFFFFFFDSVTHKRFHYLGQSVLTNYIQLNLNCNYRGGVFHPNLTVMNTSSFSSHQMSYQMRSKIILSASMAYRPLFKGTQPHLYPFQYLQNRTWLWNCISDCFD